MKIDGGCHCGNITYEAEIDPDKVIVCHCTDCQTLSGTAYRSVVIAPGEGFTMRGTPKIYVKTGDSGAPRAQAFCPECGTHLYASSVEDKPATFNIRAGTARQRADLRPQAQYWCQSALDWALDLGSLKRIEKQG